MRRFLVLAAAMLLLVGLAATAAPPAGAAIFERHCGDQHKRGFMWFDVKANNLSCRKARAVAHRYTFGRDNKPFGDRTPFDFKCGQRQVGDEVWAVRCGRVRNGVRQRVAFKYGA
jgi:hypothetical protein